MSNVLIERLPTSVEIDGREYPLDTDFRTCLRIILAFEDPDLAQAEKVSVMLTLLYLEQPENTEKAAELAVNFLDGGGESEDENGEEGPKPRIYSFEKDAQYIFSAFRQTHGIDLETVDYLHWWKFLYLFMDLGEDAFFVRLVSLRKRQVDGKLTKDEKKAVEEMGAIFQVPQNQPMTWQERESASRFMELLQQGESEREHERP